MELKISSKQRRELKGQAHNLKPVVSLGRQGLTEQAQREVDQALTHHELIKVKVALEREERKKVLQTLAERLSAALVGRVGQIGILYRPAPQESSTRT